MKKILLSVMTLFSAFAYAQNGLECIVVEKYYVSEADDTAENATGGVLPVGSVTYRLYADMLPGYKFQAAYGVDVAPTGAPGTVTAGDHELRLRTTTLFFNNLDRGAITPDFSKTRCEENSVMLDSWLSAGAACQGNFGILKTLDNGVANVANDDGMLQNNDPLAGIPLTTQDGLIAGSPASVTQVGITGPDSVFDNESNGSLFTTYNGSWSCLGGTMGPDTVDNKVLIAQITTDGIFTYELNIQIGTPGGDIQRYVARNPEGDEIMLACLIDTLGEVVVVNTPPTVSITSPANNANITNGTALSIDATAADANGNVSQVEFFVDGNSVGVDNSSAYSVNWTVASGMHTLTAKATDNLGAETTSSPVTINGVLGLSDFSALVPAFNVFPIPAKEQLHFQFSNLAAGKTIDYFVFDVVGAMLIHKTVTKQDEVVDISMLAAGEYFVKVTADGFSSTKRIIKN